MPKYTVSFIIYSNSEYFDPRSKEWREFMQRSIAEQLGSAVTLVGVLRVEKKKMTHEQIWAEFLVGAPKCIWTAIVFALFFKTIKLGETLMSELVNHHFVLAYIAYLGLQITIWLAVIAYFPWIATTVLDLYNRFVR